MQDIQVKLTARHHVDGNWEETAHSYEGKRVQKASAWYLTYKEQMEGVGEVSTTLKLTDTSITLVRQGGVSTRQQFEKGASTHSTYRSPYGPFAMETHTNKLRIRYEAEVPVQVEIAYQLWMNEQYAGEHELKIELGK
ncbi:DUF1934 domain-containing protein [Brevibacillus sp. MS2.2]|uniref:DUF1934 domain-containing protein n=1 Tax=Brevibacillus sp. MS2.2 TaxID=2738981 RepID=UPI00156B35C8|nr:DUF1934 domain-containing protein [Brevibacillus sp. MS2.2]NRR19341.1 DUF1934 domain-containing protein [Brevibacillus sp. MS2.2]